MPPKGHALLSASSSERWLHCPPSARLCESYDDKGSDYAAEGTDAHTLCEYKLRRALGMEAEDPTENLTWFNEEMADCATGYAIYVLEQVEAAKQTCSDPVVMIEQRVDFSRWVASGFGTADCLIGSVVIGGQEDPLIPVPYDCHLVTICRQSDTTEKELDFYISNDEQTFTRLSRSTPLGADSSTESQHAQIAIRQSRVPAGYGLYARIGSNGTSATAYCNLKFTYHLYPAALATDN